MCAAPQLVTTAWLSYSTCVVGRLARTAEAQGRPLTREGLFSRARIDRFLSVDCADMITQARSGYRSRLDVIAGALLQLLSDVGRLHQTRYESGDGLAEQHLA